MKCRHIKSTKIGFSVVAKTRLSQAATMVIAVGASEGGPENSHPESDQCLFVLSGVGKAISGKRRVRLSAGSLLLIEAGEIHQIVNTGRRPLETLNFYAPPVY